MVDILRRCLDDRLSRVRLQRFFSLETAKAEAMANAAHLDYSAFIRDNIYCVYEACNCACGQRRWGSLRLTGILRDFNLDRSKLFATLRQIIVL